MKATILDSRVHIRVVTYYSNLEWRNLNLFTSVIKDENRSLYDYSLIFNKNFKLFTITLSNTARSIPIHPYYLHNTEFPQKTNFYKKYFNHGSLYGMDLNNSLSLV